MNCRFNKKDSMTLHELYRLFGIVRNVVKDLEGNSLALFKDSFSAFFSLEKTE
jgi:hypothetical protein